MTDADNQNKKQDDFLLRQQALEQNIDAGLESEISDRSAAIATALKDVDIESFRSAIDFQGIKDAVQSSNGSGNHDDLEASIEELRNKEMPGVLNEISSKIIQGLIEQIAVGDDGSSFNLVAILGDIDEAKEQWNAKIDDLKDAIASAPQQYEDAVQDAATALKEKNLAEMRERQEAMAFSEDNFSKKLGEIIEQGPGVGGEQPPGGNVEFVLRTYANVAVKNPNIAEKQLDAMVQRYPEYSDQIAQVMLDSYKAGEIDLSSYHAEDADPVVDESADITGDSSNINSSQVVEDKAPDIVDASVEDSQITVNAHDFQNSEDSFAQKLSEIVIKSEGLEQEEPPEGLLNRYVFMAERNPAAAEAQLHVMEVSFPQYAGQIAQAMLEGYVNANPDIAPEKDTLGNDGGTSSLDGWDIQGGNIISDDNISDEPKRETLLASALGQGSPK